MQIRKPVVAGQFYPDDRETCLEEIRACLPAEVPHEGLPEPLVGGLVPHAGWTFSGALAALVFSAVKHQRGAVGTFVICGAAHGYFGAAPAVDGSDAWDTPLGRTMIDESAAAGPARQRHGRPRCLRPSARAQHRGAGPVPSTSISGRSDPADHRAAE